MHFSEVEIAFQQDEDPGACRVSIHERTAGTLFRLNDIDAAARGEAPVQIIEGRSYEYQVVWPTDGSLRLQESNVVQRSRISPTNGRIEPGLQVGALSVAVEDALGQTVAKTVIEVRTDKLDYHRDYRYMLASIADACLDLLLDIQAPAHTRLSPTDADDTPSLHQRVAFLRHLLTSDGFVNALGHITERPHRHMESEPTYTPTHRGVRRGGAFAAALARSSQRVLVPSSHPAHGILSEAGVANPTLPRSVRGFRRFESVDTAENRFVRYALEEFRQTLADVLQILTYRDDIGSARLSSELDPLLSVLDHHLSTPFFQNISRATTLPLGSPVLQRRVGYRDLLSTWLQFNLAGQLTWSGGDDVYSAGKKDVATLYEYWCYFLLLDVLSKVVEFNTPPVVSLIDSTQSGLHLRLKAGNSLDLVGTSRLAGSTWHVRYSYNRTFSGVPPSSTGSYPRPGSWTRPMRPDFTITLWPDELTEYEAEIAERIVHLHFDAKYRIDSYTGLFGTNADDDTNDESDSMVGGGRAKRSDLLKMHAYRDAIRRTAGAYVLYPGPNTGDVGWIEYHEILPGLGAFAARPGQELRTRAVIEQFLRAVLSQARWRNSHYSRETGDH